MDLFKNGVGRPSNETIKKRRIFYTVIAFAIILVLGLGTYLLTNLNNSSNKLKGSVSSSNSNGVELSIKYDDNSIKRIPEEHFQEEIFLTNKEGKNKITLTIKNNNNYKIYYTIDKFDQIDDDGKNYKTLRSLLYELNAKSTKSIDLELDINNAVLNPIYGDSPMESYNGSIWVTAYKTKEAQKQDEIHLRKMINVYYSKKFIKSVRMGIDCKDFYCGASSMNSGQNIVLSKGEYTTVTPLHNLNNKTIYYNWYKYNDITDSKSTYISSGTCSSISKNSFKDIALPIVINESQPRQKIKIKAYNSNTACKADKKGMNSAGVLHEDFYDFYVAEEMNYNPKTDYLVYYASGSSVTQAQVITYGTPTKLRKNEFVKEGYTFKGWVAQKNNNGKTLSYGYNSSNQVGWYEKPSKYYYYKDEQVVSKTVPVGQYVTMVAQWKKASNSNITTPSSNKTSFDKGQAVTLSNTQIYSLSTSKKKKATKSGTYYVWGSSIKNGRIRIAKKKSDAGKLFKAYGWVNVDDINKVSSSANYSLGDVNMNGKIEAKDARLITQYVGGTTTLSDAQKKLADVNKDGKVTATDASMIFKKVSE